MNRQQVLDLILGFTLGILILALFWVLPSAHAEHAGIPFLSPPAPPVPPLCVSGIADNCVEWREELRDLREISPLPKPPLPARHCGKRYGENLCD